ncbi:SufE family protein [Shewanella violacea]|uniref:Fe-S metabolism associated domain protein n=1 Tax=Shewanella violacea (strain JCM 10179 / CIP 106290 / LMG 19151 / DSS12) TaxID=637905 RepID=D4ZG67_SHEVD|nr:SufE family protein [Shewanella violacea]BAJ00666.1 Fe-S metabolism associated domain protein [Shewanella violacea DSS12]
MSSAAKPATEVFLALKLDASEILPKFENANNWQERYRQIMLLGKTLSKLEDEFRVEQAQVRGCESNAWLYHSEIDGKHYYLADSDARIVKGLVALLLTACNGKSADEIVAFDIDAYFDRLGLTGQLSPSRTNGLFALAKAIKTSV